MDAPPLQYQWQRNRTNVPGATSPVLTVTNIQLADAGSYRLVVSNAFGSVASPPSYLSVSTEIEPAWSVPAPAYVSCLAADSGGNVYLGSQGVRKYDPNGNVLWYVEGGLPITMAELSEDRIVLTSPGGTSFITPDGRLERIMRDAPGVALAVTGDHRFYITHPSTNLDGSVDFLTSEFNESGERLRSIRQIGWPKEWGTPTAFGLDANGNVVAARAWAGMLVVAQFNGKGERRWASSKYVALSVVDLGALRIDKAGNTVALVTCILQHPGGAEDVLIKYDSEGRELWRFVMPFPLNTSVPPAFAVAEDGSICVGQLGFRILKLSSEGRPLWRTRRGFGASNVGFDKLGNVVARDRCRTSGCFGLLLKFSAESTPAGILVSPSNRTVLHGANLALSATATGSPPISHQWWHNAVPTAWATNAGLAITNVQSTSLGEYVVQVNNAFGSVFSKRAEIQLETRNLVLTSLSRNRQLEFILNGVPGTYRIESTADFRTWALATTVVHEGKPVTVNVAYEAAGPGRFFRALRQE
ncbi:MAG: hypothetical protein HY735_31205 [Verrucomicrobia bacterium]|nr:hypothetical protein [Verrucomicrobiota bacterium]